MIFATSQDPFLPFDAAAKKPHVPEPAIYGLLLIGLLIGVALYRRYIHRITRQQWIRFVWRLFPSDYRRDVGIRLLRAQSSWITDDCKPRCQKTVDEIQRMRDDLG